MVLYKNDKTGNNNQSYAFGFYHFSTGSLADALTESLCNYIRKKMFVLRCQWDNYPQKTNDVHIGLRIPS